MLTPVQLSLPCQDVDFHEYQYNRSTNSHEVVAEMKIPKLG